MESLSFQEVANLINFSKKTTIDPNAILQEKSKWSLFNGINKIPPFEYVFYILYFHADATIDSIQRATEKLISPEKTHIVYAPSLDQKFSSKDFKSMISKNSVAGISTTKEYLLLFITDQIVSYCKRFSTFPKFYIDPGFTTPSGIKRKVPNPIINFLHLDTSSGDVAIIVAEPGQGKTYTTEYVASKLFQQGVIPIYIQSTQWADLTVFDLTSIWKTILHSFRYYGSQIDWIEGHEKEFLDVTLKAGIFKIVFDGFDEYILWNKGNIDPIDALKSIFTLSKQSGSNIIVTTRTSFWNSSLKESEFIANNEDVYYFEMIPFDRNQAINYFNYRFVDNTRKANSCLKIYDLVKNKTNANRAGDFTGRGFVLNLIADLVERTDKDPNFTMLGASPLQWIMLSLCQREEVRQRLPLNANEQLSVCREFAEIIACGEPPSSDNLQEIIRICKDTLPEKQVLSLVDESRKFGSLKDHPLIRRGAHEWHFVHEQIYFNLLSEQINEYALSGSQGLARFIGNLKEKGSFLDDICSTIIDQTFNSSQEEEAIPRLKRIIASFLTLRESGDVGSACNTKAKKMATTLALLGAEIICAQGEEHKNRTIKFLSLLPSQELVSLHFTRTISRMNFSGHCFKNCNFDQVTFANCQFDKYTIFDSCTFHGGIVNYCKNFGLANFINIKADQAAERLIEVHGVNDGSKVYSLDNLREDISEFLIKFSDRGKVKTLHETNFNTGLFGKSTKKEEIVRAFKKMVIESHHVSGSPDPAYHIRTEALSAFQHFLTNGVFTGLVAEAFEYLKGKLKL